MKPIVRHRKFSFTKLFIILILVAAVVVGFLMIIRHPIVNPLISHKITYGESLTSDEKARLESYFDANPPSSDITISAIDATSYDKNSTGTVAYSISLPVTGFYNPKSSIVAQENSSSLAKFAENPSDISPDNTDVYALPFAKLDSTVKLLAISDDYFLDSIMEDSQALSGAFFRILKLDTSDEVSAKNTAEKLQSELLTIPTKNNILSFIQTGVTALTRQMQTKLNAVGDASFFSVKIANFLKSADYTHTSNEVSFAKDCNINTPMAFCSDYRMFSVLEDSGIDIVELTGNHNNDWGADANIATIEFYHDKGIQTVGGGKTEEEAKIPLQLSDKNTNITLIAVNNSTSTKANGQGASGDHPGANIYDEETTVSQIKEAKKNGDFVIVDIQFFECYSYPDDGEEMPSCDLPISGQEVFFKKMVDAGADMIVGTQAHQPQTYELYNKTPIYYGLGNLFFDQIQWPGTMRSLILTHYFKDGKLLQTKVTPTMYDRNFQTAVMDGASAEKYLNRLTSYYR